MKKIKTILQNIPEKSGPLEKNTTSLRWKKDVIEFFKDKKLNNCLEIGTWHGRTTKVLSEIFKEVWTVEIKQNRVDIAKDFCSSCSNINFICGDAYRDETYATIPDKFDVIVIDCEHTYQHVIEDINRGLDLIDKKVYFVFDDYGHSELVGVHYAINDAIEQGLKIEKMIGEEKGTWIDRGDKPPLRLMAREGLIASYELK